MNKVIKVKLKHLDDMLDYQLETSVLATSNQESVMAEDEEQPEGEEQAPSSRIGQAFDSARFMVGNGAEAIERIGSQFGNLEQLVGWLESKATGTLEEQMQFEQMNGGEALNRVMDILAQLQVFEQSILQAGAAIQTLIQSIQHYDADFENVEE